MKKSFRKLHRGFFAAMLGVALLSSLASLVAPLVIQFYGQKSQTLQGNLILVVVGALVLSKALGMLLTFLRERFAKNFNKRNCRDLIEKMLGMDYDHILEEGPTSLLSQITMSVNSIYLYLTSGLISIWSAGLIALACLILVGCVNLPMAAALGVMIPIEYFGYRALNRELTRRAMQLQEDMSTGRQEILSNLQQVDHLKQLGTYREILNRIEPSTEKMYSSMARVNIFASMTSYLLGGLTEIVKTLCLLTQTLSFLSTQSSAYQLILVSIIIPLFFSAIDDIVGANINRRDFDIAQEFIQEMEENQEDMGKIPVERVDTVTLDTREIHVPGRTIPFRAQGEFHKGDIVQICGTSGKGKSTLAKAMVKFRQEEGIFYNGIPAKQIDSASLRSHVEYLAQNVPIVKGSVRDNIFLDTPWTEEGEQKILADPVLKSILENRTLDDPVLEGGANLSGGEKQKIALARGLLKQGDVLILDEVCSNIDAASAKEIYQRLAQEKENRITFIITHDTLPSGLVTARLGAET